MSIFKTEIEVKKNPAGAGFVIWWRQQDSNLPPDACKAPALPDELYPHYGRSTRIRTLDPLVPNQVRYQTALHSEKNYYTLS